MSASHRRATSGSSAMAPEMAKRTDVRSAPRSSAAAASRSNIGGTPGRNVAGRRRMAARTMSTSNLGRTTWVAPIRTANVRDRVRPKAWKKGSTA